MRPSRPVPRMAERSRPFSAASLRTTGERNPRSAATAASRGFHRRRGRSGRDGGFHRGFHRGGFHRRGASTGTGASTGHRGDRTSGIQAGEARGAASASAGDRHDGRGVVREGDLGRGRRDLVDRHHGSPPRGPARAAAAGTSEAAPITASGVPTGTVSPAGTRISRTVPAAGEGTSVSTLSVETSRSTSSSAIGSPGCFAQRRMVPSVTVSPNWGMRTVTGMSAPPRYAPTKGLRRGWPPAGARRHPRERTEPGQPAPLAAPGTSRCQKPAWATSAARSAPTPPPGASSTTTRRPVRSIEARTAAASIGARVCRSMTSTESPARPPPQRPRGRDRRPRPRRRR